MQVAVKRLETGQLPFEEFTNFSQHLQMLAFATKTCEKLCKLLGFVVLDGTICQVMPLHQQSLQQLFATSPGEACDLATASRHLIPATSQASIRLTATSREGWRGAAVFQ